MDNEPKKINNNNLNKLIGNPSLSVSSSTKNIYDRYSLSYKGEENDILNIDSIKNPKKNYI